MSMQRGLIGFGVLLMFVALLGVVSRLVRPAGIEFVFLITSFWAPFLFGAALVAIGFFLRSRATGQ